MAHFEIKLPLGATIQSVGRDFRNGITLSSDFGIFQRFFRFHWTGLMWSRSRWTCFSVAINRPTSDMSCNDQTVGFGEKLLIF